MVKRYKDGSLAQSVVRRLIRIRSTQISEARDGSHDQAVQPTLCRVQHGWSGEQDQEGVAAERNGQAL
jgi:hypothetical protein